MKYEYWFAALRGISANRKYELRQKIAHAAELFYMEETKLKRLGMTGKEIAALLKERESQTAETIEKKYRDAQEKQIQFVRRGTSGYPKRLEYIDAPPYMLYVKGKIPIWEKPCAAIVGARGCSPYGKTYAREFGKCLAQNGVLIVSGMAAGIDGFAQRGALMADGVTVAVLGCGVDICYPKENFGLYQDILFGGGAIISEYPPGTPPMPNHFPARNRIISGLSDMVLVIEAKKRSGSLITADMALEQGKEVYALPGPVNSELSQGCNELIRQGAGILISTEELLEECGFLGNVFVQKVKENQIKLESTEKLVYSCLDLSPKCLQQILEETHLSAAETIGILTELVLAGYVEEVSKNYYIQLV